MDDFADFKLKLSAFSNWNKIRFNFKTSLETLIDQRNFNPDINILLSWLESTNEKLDTCENSKFIDQKMGQLQVRPFMKPNCHAFVFNPLKIILLCFTAGKFSNGNN